MIGRRVAGLAVTVSEMDPALIQELTLAHIPAVFYDVGSAPPASCSHPISSPPRSWSEFCFPRLTTIHVPRGAIGRMAVEALFSEGEAFRAGRDIVIDPEFLVRESTGPARK
jgi:DNA-binding LacI/PurR family transcriptional regulator